MTSSQTLRVRAHLRKVAPHRWHAEARGDQAINGMRGVAEDGQGACADLALCLWHAVTTSASLPDPAVVPTRVPTMVEILAGNTFTIPGRDQTPPLPVAAMATPGPAGVGWLVELDGDHLAALGFEDLFGVGDDLKTATAGFLHRVRTRIAAGDTCYDSSWHGPLRFTLSRRFRYTARQLRHQLALRTSRSAA